MTCRSSLVEIAGMLFGTVARFFVGMEVLLTPLCDFCGSQVCAIMCLLENVICSFTNLHYPSHSSRSSDVPGKIGSRPPSEHPSFDLRMWLDVFAGLFTSLTSIVRLLNRTVESVPLLSVPTPFRNAPRNSGNAGSRTMRNNNRLVSATHRTFTGLCRSVKCIQRSLSNGALLYATLFLTNPFMKCSTGAYAENVVDYSSIFSQSIFDPGSIEDEWTPSPGPPFGIMPGYKYSYTGKLPQKVMTEGVIVCLLVLTAFIALVVWLAKTNFKESQQRRMRREASLRDKTLIVQIEDDIV